MDTASSLIPRPIPSFTMPPTLHCIAEGGLGRQGYTVTRPRIHSWYDYGLPHNEIATHACGS